MKKELRKLLKIFFELKSINCIEIKKELTFCTLALLPQKLIRNTKLNIMTKVSNEEQSNNANVLLCAVASEEFVENFTSDGELTPIDIVAEITGLTYDEIRSCSKIVCVP
jgi:hypothetical protein